MTIPTQIEALLVDLDDTLYQVEEIPKTVAANIRRYMVEKLGISQDVVHDMCYSLYIEHGTTLAGLVSRGYEIDFDDWHSFVHDTLPYEDLLSHDAKLKQMLQSIPLKKWIYTNADKKHAETCLRLLGIEECFEGIICFESLMKAAAKSPTFNGGVVCKPSHKAMELALHQAGISSQVQVAFFDDSVRNISSAYHNGVYSVLVKPRLEDGAVFEDAHQHISSMHDVPSALPWLWHLDVPAKEIGSPRGEEEGKTAAIYVQA